MVSHDLTLINCGLSTVSVKLSVDEEHFCVLGLPLSTSGGNGFATIQPGDSIHVSACKVYAVPFRRGGVRPSCTMYMHVQVTY